MEDKINIPIGLFILNLEDEMSEGMCEKHCLVMECLEKHLPDYFAEHYSDKMFMKNVLRETLIEVEKLLITSELSTMLGDWNITKAERKNLLEKAQGQLFAISDKD